MSKAQSASARWESCRRMVVKVGSSLLVDQTTGNLRREWIESLADDIAAARNCGREIIVVSSANGSRKKLAFQMMTATIKAMGIPTATAAYLSVRFTMM